jgi:hypothetical protein
VKAVVRIDLPSEESMRDSGALARVRSWFSNELGSGQEHILLSTLAVIEGLAEGLRAAGVDDVVRFEVDGETIYEDSRDEQGDLPFIVTQAIGAGLLDKPFAHMELHAADEVAGERMELVATVAARVDKGDEELVLSCSAGRASRDAFRQRVEVIARAIAAKFGEAPWRLLGM